MADHVRGAGSLGMDSLGGRYRLLEKIGAGSMAVVHRAFDEFLEREVAVKLIDSTAVDEAELRRSDAEVKLLARLSHPGLVTLLDAGTEWGAEGTSRIFLVMELVTGPDLRARLKEGPLPPARVAEIGHDLAEALGYIHGKGVVHRDIKPANILLLDEAVNGTRAHAKLTDFGIALMTESVLTLEDAVSGTPAYLSPEQVRGDTASPASDVYSLGLVLLQCLTGELAFPGAPLESAVRRLTQNPPIPESVDPLWRDLVVGMTALEPAQRLTAVEAAASLYRLAALGAVSDLAPLSVQPS
ncbi:serine/threonine-protein kinase [Sinomonas terrae]|uniref:non-specific serine/threonine protein kinase n=1 Tax=Sinomonas terrae TaxID=2908838 RepID=A0ABS9U4T0_9MICC|nr:serine/threonine-protein kinase [Sinomonas terrae]MCH6471665.1 serine/threonine protein kinase [Sinomonas terrae]